MLFAGSAMDRYPMRRLIVAGIVALATGLVLISLASAIWQIIALYSTLVAIGFTLSATLASQVLAAKWFPHRVGFAVGLVLLGSNLGGIVMPPAIGWLLGALRLAQRGPRLGRPAGGGHRADGLAGRPPAGRPRSRLGDKAHPG